MASSVRRRRPDVWMNERPKIVVLDGHTLNPGDLSWRAVGDLGSLQVYSRTDSEELIARARGAAVVLTNKTVLGADFFAAIPEVRLVCVLATGTNVVDLEAARAHEVTVCNVPEYGTSAVAQHVFALLLALTNHVAHHDRAIRRGAWTEAQDFTFWERPSVELAGKVMGIVGLGRIGRRVAQIARAMGMDVVACGRRSVAADDGIEGMSADELFACSDVVTLHCPLTAETHGLMNRKSLGKMKPTAVLINTSRGGLICEVDLIWALETGVIAGAGLDVASTEPLPAGHSLLRAPNCVVTPHMAWTAREARRRLLQTTVENIVAFLAGSPQHVV
jgi:glycerate dehydrogenase